MILIRALTIWLLIILVESVHGAIRQILIAPLIGDFQARRLSVFSGMFLILMISLAFIRWINAPDKRTLFSIGIIWVVLTVAFELGLGIFVFAYSWERIFEDYNVARGGLMGFGLLFMLFAPFLAESLQAVFRRKHK